jgi:uncharacterized repeat protein (TIGR03943 family)
VWSNLLRFRGAFAIVALAVLSLTLAFDGTLAFYIHPRYNVFTITMGIIAVGLAIVASIFYRAEDHPLTGTHRHSDSTRTIEKLSALLVTGFVALAILLPSTTLSSFTAANRAFNEGAINPDMQAPTDLSREAFALLTVRDWASLISQNQDPAFYRGKTVNAVGTVSMTDERDVFLLTRFVVTCCAVDAQPVSIPVFLPGWQEDFAVDDWVLVGGGFQSAGLVGLTEGLVVVPTEIGKTEVPREPYLF